MSLVEALPYVPAPTDTPFARRCAVYALAAVDEGCAEYVGAHALAPWERRRVESVSADLRTVPSTATHDGFVSLAEAS